MGVALKLDRVLMRNLVSDDRVWLFILNLEETQGDTMFQFVFLLCTNQLKTRLVGAAQFLRGQKSLPSSLDKDVFLFIEQLSLLREFYIVSSPSLGVGRPWGTEKARFLSCCFETLIFQHLSWHFETSKNTNQTLRTSSVRLHSQ